MTTHNDNPLALLSADPSALIKNAVVGIKNPTEQQRYAGMIGELFLLLMKVADTSQLDSDGIRKATEGFSSFLYNASGRSLNSLRQIKHSLGLYLTWCTSHSQTCLPSTAHSVSLYMRWLDINKQHAPSTVSAHLSVVSLLHRIAGLVDITKTQHVIDSMASIRMNASRNGYISNQQEGFRKHHLIALHQILYNSDTPRDIRDLALLSLAWDSLLRESELARITFSMLKRNRTNGHYIGRIAYTKTTSKKKDNEGDVFFVSKDTYELLVRAVTTIGGDPKDKAALIFMPITKAGSINKRFFDETTGFQPMKGLAIDKIFDRAHSILQPNDTDKPWRGHSARIGRAQDLSESGATNKQIMQLGRWNDPKMPSRYTREQDLTEIAAKFL